MHMCKWFIKKMKETNSVQVGLGLRPMLWVDILVLLFWRIRAGDRLDAGAFIILKFTLLLLLHAPGGFGVSISCFDTSGVSLL